MNERTFTHSAWRDIRAMLRVQRIDSWQEVDKAGRNFLLTYPDAWLNWGAIEYDEYESEDTVYIVGYTRAKMLTTDLWRFGPFGWHLGSNRTDSLEMFFHRKQNDYMGYTLFNHKNTAYFDVDGRLFSTTNLKLHHWREPENGGAPYPSITFNISPLGYSEDYPDIPVPPDPGCFLDGKKLKNSKDDLARFTSKRYEIAPEWTDGSVKERYWPTS